jgi:negative regulator of flagellin synthesis FlgM
MFRHGPSCLPGPVSRSRWDWSGSPAALAGDPDTAVMSADDPEPTPPDPDVRADLVERVRREIAEGTYDTPKKWDAALDRLLDRLRRGEA